MSFQSIVMTTSVIILILSLCLIGLALYRQKYNSDYPPVIANCPDYWIDKSKEGNGKKCENIKNLGNPACGKEMDFTTAQWSGEAGFCAKSKWAKTCNLTWDGLSDNAELCG